MFKKDQKIILVDDNALTAIKKGKTYIVAKNQSGDGVWVAITNDCGYVEEYRADRFKEAEVPFKDAPIGTTVFCMMFGEGVIYTTTRDSERFPIGVKFTNGSTNSYTPEGKHHTHHGLPVLYYAKPEIKAPSAPVFVPTMVGKQVLVSRPNGETVRTGKVTEETETTVFVNSVVCMKDSYIFHEIGQKLL